MISPSVEPDAQPSMASYHYHAQHRRCRCLRCLRCLRCCCLWLACGSGRRSRSQDLNTYTWARPACIYYAPGTPQRFQTAAAEGMKSGSGQRPAAAVHCTCVAAAHNRPTQRQRVVRKRALVSMRTADGGQHGGEDKGEPEAAELEENAADRRADEEGHRA
jgi:hypothetical protein